MDMIFTNVPKDPYIRWIEQELAKQVSNPNLVLVTNHDILTRELIEGLTLNPKKSIRWDEESI